MRYGSVCSGIEAASVAWGPLGWEAAFFAEVALAPSAVLAHRFPEVPNLGDFTQITADHGPIDLLVGGTPCQDFSVAGLRRGLAGDRGNLTLEFLRLADRLRPRWLVYENVPGLLSQDGGRAFGAFLGGLAELGYGWSYRVLDAQYVRVDGHARAVPQRRRRVFVVGHLGDWRRAVAVLLERQSLSGHPAPRREAGTRVAGSLAARPRSGGVTAQDAANGLPVPGVAASVGGNQSGPIDVATTLTDSGGTRGDLDSETFLVSRPIPFDTTQITSAGNVSNPQPGDPCHPIAARAHTPAIAVSSFNWQAGGKQTTLGANQTPAIAFMERGRTDGRAVEWQEEVAYAQDVKSGGGAGSSRWVAHGYTVRRLTPIECERLQGFPDNWTLVPIKPVPAKGQGKARALMEEGDSRFADIGGVIHIMSADTARYMMLGNSMAVNCMRWIGRRIANVEAIR